MDQAARATADALSTGAEDALNSLAPTQRQAGHAHNHGDHERVAAMLVRIEHKKAVVICLTIARCVAAK